MDKKNTAFFNKFFKIGKIGKKGKKTPLKYRRSISVPDLLGTHSRPYVLDSDQQSSDTDTNSFTGIVHSQGGDEANVETHSLNYSQSFNGPETTSSSKDIDTPAATPWLHSDSSQEQLTAGHTSPLSQAQTGTQEPTANTNQAPAIDVIIGKDKRQEDKERNTKWYIEDDDSRCSTPLEDTTYNYWPNEHDFPDSSTPITTDMFIIGSAENTNEVSNETNDYDTTLSAKDQNASAVGQKIQYILTINLREGKNLVIRDRSGTSDPYVKFKIDGKTVYKSKVINKNLNPQWNECFSILVRDLEQSVFVQVFDRDLRSRDFMGSSTISLSSMELDKNVELTLRLDDPGSLENDMGMIFLDVSVSIYEGNAKRNKWPLKRKGSFNKGQLRAAAIQKSQVWNGVYTVVLVEGQDMAENGQGDVFVRFRFGDQRFRSKNLCVKSNPQWREKFEFNRFEDGSPDMLLVEVLCKKGRKCEECWGMHEVDLSRVPNYKTQSYNLSVGKGWLVFLVTTTPCSGVSVSDLSSSSLDEPRNYENLLQQFDLKNTLKNIHDIGYLQVKVLKALDLSSTDRNGKSDPFCVLELGNSKLQTPTIYKTLHPEWRTTFTLPVKDIHEILMLTVFGEDGDKAPDFLGKAAFPLLTISNGQQITSLLKKENLTGPSKGSITVEMNLFYNPVRAAIRTFSPKETKLEENSLKFNKKLLARNIYRVRRLSMALLYTLQYIKSCFQWESTQRSIVAFLTFLVTVWNFEPFMLPLFLLLLIGWNYYHNTGSHSQELENISTGEDEDEDEKELEKRGLMEKIHMVQEIVLTVQHYLDEAACLGERVKNTFNWSVPFLTFLACWILFIATAALYYIPLRYIVLIWGINKFTKRLRNPHAIDSNEILDFLQRVPSDVQKVQYGELRVPGVPSAQKKKR